MVHRQVTRSGGQCHTRALSAIRRLSHTCVDIRRSPSVFGDFWNPSLGLNERYNGWFVLDWEAWTSPIQWRLSELPYTDAQGCPDSLNEAR